MLINCREDGQVLKDVIRKLVSGDVNWSSWYLFLLSLGEMERPEFVVLVTFKQDVFKSVWNFITTVGDPFPSYN